jgi:hypothetical protein
MNRLILSHTVVAAFVASLVALWKSFATFYACDPAPLVCIVLVYGGVTCYFAITQAKAAVREAKAAVLYPSGGVRNQAGRCDPVSDPTY